MDRNPAFPGDFVNPILQMVQWDIHAAVDMSGRPLARISDIQ